jgi:hypothetical protein
MLIAVIDMAGRRSRSWYRSPGLKKINPDEVALLRLLQRWRDEAIKAERTITRIALAARAARLTDGPFRA